MVRAKKKKKQKGKGKLENKPLQLRLKVSAYRLFLLAWAYLVSFSDLYLYVFVLSLKFSTKVTRLGYGKQYAKELLILTQKGVYSESWDTLVGIELPIVIVGRVVAVVAACGCVVIVVVADDGRIFGLIMLLNFLIKTNARRPRLNWSATGTGGTGTGSLDLGQFTAT